jgi:phage portal protein BeeE
MLGNLIRRPDEAEMRSAGQISFPDYMRLWERVGFNGLNYMVPNGALSTLTALQAMRNPIVQAAIMLRASCLMQIRFATRERVPAKGSRELGYSPSLDILDRPFPGALPGELPMRMEIDGSLYGNSYWYESTPLGQLGASNPTRQLTWLDPTKMKILTGDQEGPTGKKCGRFLLAYQVQDKDGSPEETFLPGEIVHYRPLPDPDHPFRGLSWLSALLPDITADQDMTTYKHAFLSNAATPNLVVMFQNNIGEDAFKAFRERMESTHTGPANGFKTLYLGSGADVKVVGSNFAELNLNDNQAYGETRLAVASGVPASLLGIAEGMKGSTLNTANYAATRRRFSDMTIRPAWRIMCGALEVVAPPGPGRQLWYDDRDIPFLAADLQDQAVVMTAEGNMIVQLTNAGYDTESVKSAVIDRDWSQLGHSGFMSVQLQPRETLPKAPSVAPTGDNAGDGGDSSGDGAVG